MDFVKMQGLGNDFVVVAGPLAVDAGDVAAWCDRRRGIGADGVLVATRHNGGAAMEYWNADGSPAEMCGNGLRCVARYAHDREWAAGPSFVIETSAGERPVTITGEGMVRALIGSPGDGGVAPFDIAGFHVEPLSMGNPHAVIVVDDCYATPVDGVGPLVEGDPAFPERTNVEFLSVVGRNHLALRVWERGVGETLACGSGAAAATVIAHRKGLTGPKVTVDLLGGQLQVEVAEDGVWIEGPAEYVYEGRW